MSPGRRLALLLLAVFLVLGATAGERTLGTITDEQQMLATAVAIAETGGLGVARGQFFSVERPSGDALAPYGLGQPLVEVPFVLLAGPWERAFGPRSSQTLFSLLSVLLVTAAAGGAGLLARAAGASPPGEAVAVLGTAFGSPLWGYTSTVFSEPLQAACLALSAAFAALSVRSGNRAPAVGAGVLAGLSVLAKSANLLLVPFVLAPLLLDGPPGRTRPARTRLALAGAAGAGATLLAWLVLEVRRFGRPFASYAGQGFTHPPLDGLWRLLGGANEGLLWYFPLAALAAVGAARLGRDPALRGTVVAVSGPFAVLVALASAWWSWDGVVGWGPRLVVPAVPLLAAAAGAASDRFSRGRLAAAALLAAGVGVNALGALQSDASRGFLLDTTPPAVIAESETAQYPASVVRRDPQGRPVVPRSHAAARDAAFSPIRVHAFLLGVKLGAGSRFEAEERLSRPPWLATHPEARPAIASLPGTFAEVLVNDLLEGFRWPHLFSVLGAGEEERRATFNAAWGVALADQLNRALDVGDAGGAVELSGKLWAAAPSGFSAAQRGEALRVAGRGEEATAFLGGLPQSIAASPLVALERALLARDAGDAELASALLGRAAPGIPSPAVRRAREVAPARWPRTLRDFLRLEQGAWDPSASR